MQCSSFNHHFLLHMSSSSHLYCALHQAHTVMKINILPFPKPPYISPPPKKESLVAKGHLIIEASRSHPDTPHPVWFPWTRDQPDMETSTWQHLQRKDIHAPGGIWSFSPSKRAAADPHLRPHYHWARSFLHAVMLKSVLTSWLHGLSRSVREKDS